MSVIAIIPVKEYSSRVPNKNFKEFISGKSLLEIKIEQCKNSKHIDAIYVSSESLKAKEIAEHYGVNFILRDEILCRSHTPWHEVLTGIINSIDCDDDAFIAWSPVTSPLFNRFDEAIIKLKNQNQYDSLMTVTKLKYFMLNEHYQPINFTYGVWASHTQHLSPFYQMNCALWLAKKIDILNNKFQLGTHPYHLECTDMESIDIDYPEEFELAQVIYKHLNGN